MKELREYQARLMERMWAQPELLRQAIASFEQAQLHQPLEQNGWSPHQIVAHICQVEWGAFLPRFEMILEKENPSLVNFDQTAWLETYYDPEVPVEDLLQDFQSVRQSARELLGSIMPEQFSRTGRHPYQGERTLQWWMEYAVSHVNDHLTQLGAS